MADQHRLWLVKILHGFKQGLKQVLLQTEGAKPLAAM